MSKIVAGIIVAAGLAAPALAQTTQSGTAAWDVDVRILVDGDPASPYTGSGVEVLPGTVAGTFRVGLTLQARANVAAGFFNGGIGRLFGASAVSGVTTAVSFTHNAGAGSRLIASDIGANFNTLGVPGQVGTFGSFGFETSAGGAAGLNGAIFRGAFPGNNFGVTTAVGFITGGGSPSASSPAFSTTTAGVAIGQSTSVIQDFGSPAGGSFSSSPFQSIYRFVFETTNASLTEATINFQGIFTRIFGTNTATGGALTGGQLPVVTAAGIAAGTGTNSSEPLVSSGTAFGRLGFASLTIAIPTPGAAALLGLGGLVAARRRR